MTSSFQIRQGGQRDPQIIYNFVNPSRDGTETLVEDDIYTNCADIGYTFAGVDTFIAGFCDEVVVGPPIVEIFPQKTSNVSSSTHNTASSAAPEIGPPIGMPESWAMNLSPKRKTRRESRSWTQEATLLK